MPTYTFRCTTCEHEWDEKRSFTESSEPPSSCPYCMNDYVNRVWNSAPVHFKGTGFYKTDK